MAQVIPFTRKPRSKGMSLEEKKQWGENFQNLLRDFNSLKKMEQELEWKIRVKCQKELKQLDTLRMKLQTINGEIRKLTQKLEKPLPDHLKPKS